LNRGDGNLCAVGNNEIGPLLCNLAEALESLAVAIRAISRPNLNIKIGAGVSERYKSCSNAAGCSFDMVEGKVG